MAACIARTASASGARACLIPTVLPSVSSAYMASAGVFTGPPPQLAAQKIPGTPRARSTNSVRTRAPRASPRRPGAGSELVGAVAQPCGIRPPASRPAGRFAVPLARSGTAHQHLSGLWLSWDGGGAALDDCPQFPPVFTEDLGRHKRQICGHRRSEIHLAQHVTLQVDAGGDLDQGDIPVAELEYGPLGDIEHALSRVSRVGAAEADLLDMFEEFLLLAFLDHVQLSVTGSHLQAAGGERPAVDDCLAAIGDIDETADADSPAAEPADVDVSLPVGLGEAEKGHVDAAAVIPVKHRLVLDERFGVGRGPEVQARAGPAADSADLRGEREQRGHVFLGSDAADPIRDAVPEVDHGPRHQLHGRPPAYDQSLVHRKRRDTSQRGLEVTGQEPG